MKIGTGLTAAFAVATIAGTAMADGQIRVDKYPNGAYNAAAVGSVGSGFRVNKISGNNGQFGGQDGSATSLMSFCLEESERIDDQGEYYTVVSDRAMFGGGNGGPNGDVLSSQTAALYSAFYHGELFGGSPSTTDTDDLQIAIWILEGERGGSGRPGVAALLAWADEATDNDGINDRAGFNRFLGQLGDVRVLQLWSDPNAQDPNHARQDLLTIAPLPPAAWAGFSTLACVAGIGYIRRRQNQAQ